MRVLPAANRKLRSRKRRRPSREASSAENGLSSLQREFLERLPSHGVDHGSHGWGHRPGGSESRSTAHQQNSLTLPERLAHQPRYRDRSQKKFRPRSERLTFTELASESLSAPDRDIDAAFAASEISRLAAVRSLTAAPW
jgi:hypothetical protein